MNSHKKGYRWRNIWRQFFFQLKDLSKNFWINSSLERKAQVPQLLNREYWQNSSTSISVCLSFKASNKFKLLTVQDLSSLYCASPIKRICENEFVVLIYISILFSYSPFCFPHPDVPYHPLLWSASPSCTFWIDSCKFCPNFAQLQGIHIVFIMIKVNIIFFIKLLKGEAGGWTAITFAFVFFTLIFPDQHHVKKHSHLRKCEKVRSNIIAPQIK